MAMEKEVIWHDLGSKEPMMEKPEGEMTVVASPVFGGRIPSVVREKIEKFSGTGKKAVTIAVYGNRAYEDALLEMNDILTKCGFTVIASGAFVAQHSMAPEIGAGRPDGEDEKEIHKFAETVKNSTAVENVQVPGNRPYKPEMNMPVDRVREILKISQEPVSLETPIGEEEDSHLGDFIQDDNVPVPADAAAFTLLKEQLEEVLGTLTEREQKVLTLRFGLEDGRARTLEEVGREFNVTRERIRQIEAKALRKLRHPSRSRKLKDYLE